MDIGSYAVGESEPFGILALSLDDLIHISGTAFASRVVELVTTGNGAGRPEDRSLRGLDLAVAEIHKAVGHFNLRRDNADHLRIVNRFGEVHQTAALRIETLSRLDELPDGGAHGRVGLQLLAIDLRITAAKIQEICLRHLTISERRKLNDPCARLLQSHPVCMVVEGEGFIIRNRDQSRRWRRCRRWDLRYLCHLQPSYFLQIDVPGDKLLDLTDLRGRYFLRREQSEMAFRNLDRRIYR